MYKILKEQINKTKYNKRNWVLSCGPQASIWIIWENRKNNQGFKLYGSSTS